VRIYGFRQSLKKFTAKYVKANKRLGISKQFLNRLISGKLDPYVDYKIKKNRFGKYRSISSPVPQLKSLQKQILDELYEIECHHAAHAYIPGKSVATAANLHLRMTWGIRLDLEDFFHHVTHRHLEKALHSQFGIQKAAFIAHVCTRTPENTRGRIPTKYKRRFNLWDAWRWKNWLRKHNAENRDVLVWTHQNLRDFVAAITSKLMLQKRRVRRYLPQGAPTSGYLSNLAFAELDANIATYLQSRGFSYSRYSDDIMISTDTVDFDRNLAGQIIHQIQKMLHEEGFTLNRAKTRILSPGARKSYLGLIVGNGHPTRLPIEVRRRITGELRDIKKFGFESQALRFEKGMSRIRRHPSKEKNSENTYWYVLHGLLCWVEVADLRLFFDLEALYRPMHSDGTVAIELEADPDAKFLAELFERKKPKSLEPSPINLQSGIDMVDIDLKF
jgi:hypothetical protein